MSPNLNVAKDPAQQQSEAALENNKRFERESELNYLDHEIYKNAELVEQASTEIANQNSHINSIHKELGPGLGLDTRNMWGELIKI